MNDLISRQAAIDGIKEYIEEYSDTDANGLHDLKWCAMKEAEMLIEELPSAQPEIVRCKDCNKASKCYGDVIMRSRGGGNIYCPLEFCSEAERRTDEGD